MELSPLYNFLIFLEDRKAITKEELSSFGERSSQGIIGKMEAMKLISRREDKGNACIYLSEKGYSFLNSILDAIHKGTLHWDNKWRIISFSVPEKDRSKRDRFRRYLEATGFKMISNGIWISPINLKSEVIAKIQKLVIEDKVLFVETNEIFGISDEKIKSIWNFEKVCIQFESFIKKANNLIEDKIKKTNKFEIKRLIFEYALILNNEPRVPIEFIPRGYPAFRAKMIYKKLKSLLD